MAEEPELVLTPPAPVKVVSAEKAVGLVPLDETERSELDARAAAFVDKLVQLDGNSPEFGKRAEQLHHLGQREIERAAGESNRFLARPVKAMASESSVGSDLAALRRTIEELDPSRHQLSKPKKLFGLIPFGDKVLDYFDGYKSAQGHISSILERLSRGRDELLKDNAAIDVERQNLWGAMHRLEQMVHVAKALDTQLEARVTDVAAREPEKAKALREGPLFAVRQRTTDLMTQMAVSVQGYLALDLVKKNNIELMKGVDRASTTTVSALRTAVTVAQAMTNQKLVLGQITALNTTTAGIIESTSELLRAQTGKLHEQAASATVPVDTLQRAFENIYQTMDTIDNFKSEALSNMQKTVDQLSAELNKAQGYIARSEGAQTALEDGEPDPFRLTD